MWIAVTILPRHKLTSEAVEVSVQPRFGTIQFEHGQFVVLEIMLEQGIRRSAFSIVRAEGKGIILGVKKNGEDGISSYLQELNEPIKASLAGPFGQFQLDMSARAHLFITGGSGITPVRSMFDILLEQNVIPTLIYSNQSEEKAMYLASFRKLAEQGFITLIEVYDRNIQGALEGLDLTDTSIYTCGPPGLIRTTLNALAAYGVAEKDVHTEKYGLEMGHEKLKGSFKWRNFWGSEREITMTDQRSMLQGALESELRIPHACEVGVCGTCKVRVLEGEVLCGKEIRGAGQDVLTCISQPIGESDSVIGAVKGGRAELVTIFLIVGALLLGLWWVPPAQGFKALGPMNTSHENLECGACHKDAPGTIRQQLSHNTRSLLGMHESLMVPVGFAPIDNKVCLECHNRPNDRHPTSRFLETKFAEQRATLGPHECNNCHGEHHGERVAMVEPGFCRNCHQDMEVNFDTATPSHAELIEDDAWETCLQCHDFHGNHMRDTPTNLAAGIAQETILKYLKGGPDPYGNNKTNTASLD